MTLIVNYEKFHEGITHRLSVIGVPINIIRGFSNDVIKWTKCSGVEWTISRLKALKVDLIRSKSQLQPLSKVRKNRKGEIAGVLGSMFRYSLKSEKNFNQILQSLMVYSMFKFESLTPTQTKKFLAAITCEPAKIHKSFLLDLGRSIRMNFPQISIERNKELSLLVYRGSPSKFKPRLTWTSWPLAGLNKPSRAQDKDVLSNAEYFMNPNHVSLYFEYEDLYSPLLKGLPIIIDKINDLGSWYKHGSCSEIEGGEIHFLQEQGGKLRSVASPHLVHQLALKPFGDAVYSRIQTLPWDCTFDQSKPFSLLQQHLLNGNTIHSIDLSSATDYFPLEIQMTVLRAFFGNLSDLRLFEDISRSKWRTSETSVPDFLRWKRGQPLGLYPSFGVFTLTHGILLWYLNGCQHNNSFYVVGDDVVILDKDLYIKYIKLLELMNCPYSREKSISSANICEFAGKIVTSTTVLPQYKWREISNDNFLDICRQLGRRSRSLLSKRQRAIFDKVKHCCLPFGLNFSYPGSNLVKMQAETDRMFLNEETVVGSMMGLSSTIFKNVYEESHFLDPQKLVLMDEVLKIIVTFDEKVRSVLLKLLPKELIATFVIFLKDYGGLSGVPEAISSNRELPSLRLLPSRVTVLDRMESILSMKGSR
jgi:hypothetical protein